MTPSITTVNNDTITQAVALLQAGKLVCFPTETVYALAADSRNDAAVAAIYHAKSRGKHIPLALLAATIEQAKTVALFDNRAEILARSFFPGPLTLVLPVRPGAMFSPLLNQGGVTIAIRIPDHPVALAILQAIGYPIAATSTNISGRPSATCVDDIEEEVRKHIALIIDGGVSRFKQGSTVVDISGGQVQILREGDIKATEIMKMVNHQKI